MRYHNERTGIDVDLTHLDDEKKRFFEAAREKFRRNVSWFEFEQLVFSYTSPLFRHSRNRAEVVNDPLFLALKDMWLQLGIKQGFVASGPSPSHARAGETKTRPSGPQRTSRIGDVASTGQPSGSRRRGR